MTINDGGDREARLARKAVIARQLTDPLGRLGFRHARPRVEREARARRAVFVTALGAFAATFVAITGRTESTVTTPSSLAPVVNAPSANALNALGREIAPRETPVPHVRTRSS